MSLAELLKDELPQGRFWTDAWSLVEGCTPVSPGCANCWLAGMYKRNLPNLQADVAGEYTTPTGEKHYRFHGNVICREDRLDKPLRARKPRVYAIWSDLFHEGVSPDFVMRALSVMALTPRHQYIIVTKRPHKMADLLKGPKEMWRDILSHKAGQWFGDEAQCTAHNIIEGVVAPEYSLGWPLSNVTILVTMEDQQRADERIPAAIDLAQAGWSVGALCEPLLGPISFGNYFEKDAWLKFFKWLITGGESGHGARPAHQEWFRSLRDQAKAVGVPFLFKGWGEWQMWDQNTVDDDPEQTKFLTMEWREDHWEDVGYPDWMDLADYVDGDHCTARVGKHRSGRTLDGREWLEVPE